jgi:predicted lipoprotein with Yx(FWY)xxD motif
MTRSLCLAAVSLFALTSAASAALLAPIATPEGITLEPLGKDQGYDTGKKTAATLGRDQIAFANAKGLTLYTYAKDTPGKASCVADCAASWPAALANKEAKTFGDWSKIKRDDGALQWAYKGKALYTYVKDVDPGSVAGNSPMRFGGTRVDGAGRTVGGGIRGSAARTASKDVPMPADWTPAMAYPMDIALPNGVAVREVPDAAAWALVNYKNQTLYTFDGNPNKDKIVGTGWTPAVAPLLAAAVGDFAFVVRDDGIKQWTYKGKGLYTYAEDLTIGDANGSDIDKTFSVASVARYYMPPDVTLQNTAAQGRVIATKTGMTLYRRDGYIYQSGGGHSLRRGVPTRPAVGRDLGTHAGCDAECLKTWHPFTAPADAKAQGFWNVAARDDGSKQWTYQGYSLWTFDGDKKPGDINGHDTYEFKFSEDPRAAIPLSAGTPMDGAPGLAWLIAIP